MRELANRIRQRLDVSLWVVPLAASLLGILAAYGASWVDRRYLQGVQAWFLFTGDAESARQLLSTVATALMTVTGVVFSITILVLQLASQQFSPRVLRTFLEERWTRFTLGTFMGTFVYATTLLLVVRTPSAPDGPFVPALAVFLAYVAVVVSVGVFVRYLHHVAHSIRAIHIIQHIANDARRTIADEFPDEPSSAEERDAPSPPGDRDAATVIVNERGAGVVGSVDAEHLVRVARERDQVVELVRQIGDFVPRGAPLVRVWGGGPVDKDALLDGIHLCDERTPRQDPGFCLRQLVDIAERSLSPGTNDPTTAVQVLDQIQDLLRMLADRRFPPRERRDGNGRLRLIVPHQDWGAYVHLGLDEIRQYGRGSLQVMKRLRAALEDLRAATPAHRRAPIDHQWTLLIDAQERGFDSPLERELASTADHQDA